VLIPFGAGEIAVGERDLGILSREIDLSFLWRSVRNNPACYVLGLGVLLRVGAYLWNRPYWQDEGALLANLKGMSIFDFSDVLRQDQLAPFGFMIVERCLVSLFGDSGYVTRIVPLLCAVGSLWLFKKLADEWLSSGSALVALALFALSDDLVYYSSELKPYSSDVTVCLAILLASSRLAHQQLGSGHLATMALLAVVAPWVSFPSSFVIAGCGTALLVDRLGRRSWSETGRLVFLGLCWLVSFVLAYRAAHSLLHAGTTMYVFWNFAFLPVPPSDLSAVRAIMGMLLEFFVNPLNLVSPFMPALGVVLPTLLFLIGATELARRDRTVCLFLIMPIVLALVAAALRRYPFHGRLLLGLSPCFYLLIAAGTGWARPRLSRRLYVAVLALLLFYPCLSTLYQASGKRQRDFNSHGDLHGNLFMR
jgi:hypothetical protein